MKQALIGIAGALLSASAVANPVYLDCTMTSGQEDLLWKVMLDEANGTVSYTIPDIGTAQKLPAVFSQDKVVFGSMEISRVDLAFRRTVEVAGNVRTNTGKCALTKAPKRQF